MLPKSHRFSFKKGAPKRIYPTSLFVIRYDNKEEKGLKVAVVVGKKVDKKAVIRNKVKRQLIKILKELVPLDTNFEIVVFAKKGILDNQNEEITQHLKNALIKTQIIK